MVRFERQGIVVSAVATAVLGGSISGMLSVAGGQEGPTWRKPFQPDEHTVVLYHFDEGEGNVAHDACGDSAFTLRANKEALWGQRAGFKATARF